MIVTKWKFTDLKNKKTTPKQGYWKLGSVDANHGNGNSHI